MTGIKFAPCKPFILQGLEKGFYFLRALLLLHQIPGQLNMLLLEHLLAVVPLIDFRLGIADITGVFSLRDPMNGGEQF